MPDCSRIFVTIHPDDDKKFWEITEEERPGPREQLDRGRNGEITYEIDAAISGGEQFLTKAAKAGLRFYGEDMGLVGAWGPMVFAAINGKIHSCCCSVETGPVAVVHWDGTVSEQDVKDAKDYYAALKAVEKSMKEPDLEDPELHETDIRECGDK